MDYLSLILEGISLYSAIQNEVRTGTSLKSVTNIITNKNLLNIFEQLGSKLYPKLAPELHAVAAIVTSYSPDYTMWVQRSLNALLPALPQPLTVDGKYGHKTRAAVEVLQAQLGLKVDGWAGDVTMTALSALLKK